MTTNIDRATQVIAESLDRIWGYDAPNWGDDIAASLADAGLLTPGPRIIRTRDELAALDPDTLVTSRIPVHDARPGCQVFAFPAPAAHRFDLTWCGPMVVLATGDQVRAALQALTEEA